MVTKLKKKPKIKYGYQIKKKKFSFKDSCSLLQH